MRIKTAAVEELRAMIDRADYLYYTGVGDSGWSDSTYDHMKSRLKELAPGDARLTRVGPPESFIDTAGPLTKVAHKVPMPSLNNAMSIDEFRAWMSKLPGGLDSEVAASYKLDGVAIDLTYVFGKLVRALTRGPQGATGQDVTNAALRFDGVPRELPEPVTVNVRGEAIMRIEAFEAVNEQRSERDEELFRNPRNAAAGIIQRSSGDDAEFITFYGHMVLGYPETAAYSVETKMDQYEILHGWGFEVVPHVLCEGFDDVVSHWEKLGKHRDELEYWIDGLVVFANLLDTIESMGIVSRRPRAGIAFKWTAERATTIVEDVIITVGRSGKIAPTAALRPVELCGTTVSNAFLHNQANMDRLGLDIGDEVVIEKGGEIIPQVVEVTRHEKSALGVNSVYRLPTTCPVCGGTVGRRKNVNGTDTVDLFCLNMNCPAKATGTVERWISSLEIKGIGPEILSALFEQGLVSEVADLYTLEPYAIEGLKLSNGVLGMSRAESIIEEINNTRTLTIPKFIGSLGIHGLGKRRVEMIIKAFIANVHDDTINLCTCADWINNSSQLVRYAEQLGIPGMAEPFHAALVLRQSALRGLFHIISVEDYAMAKVASHGSLSGNSFCLTGKMSRPRQQIAQDIIDNGGEVSDRVKAGLTYLVQADASSQSAKTVKAAKLGTEVIDEETLIEMMGG